MSNGLNKKSYPYWLICGAWKPNGSHGSAMVWSCWMLTPPRFTWTWLNPARLRWALQLLYKSNFMQQGCSQNCPQKEYNNHKDHKRPRMSFAWFFLQPTSNMVYDCNWMQLSMYSQRPTSMVKSSKDLEHNFFCQPLSCRCHCTNQNQALKWIPRHLLPKTYSFIFSKFLQASRVNAGHCATCSALSTQHSALIQSFEGTFPQSIHVETWDFQQKRSETSDQCISVHISAYLLLVLVALLVLGLMLCWWR